MTISGVPNDACGKVNYVALVLRNVNEHCLSLFTNNSVTYSSMTIIASSFGVGSLKSTAARTCPNLVDGTRN